MEVHWLYVSRSRIGPRDIDAAMEDIVVVARARNGALGVTGALIFSGGHFAQYLEGPESAINDLRQRIGQDVRHTDIVTLSEGPISQRRFTRWSLAYAGPSQFVARTVSCALQEMDAPNRTGVNKLLRLMDEFVSQSQSSAA